MADQHHLITPPPELVGQWLDEYFDPAAPSGMAPGEAILHIAAVAARWGADQELEACCDWIDTPAEFETVAGNGTESDQLRDARRPKPQSLKEQALAKLAAMERLWEASGNQSDDIIRRALEQLDD